MGLFWGGDRNAFRENIFEKVSQILSAYIESKAKDDRIEFIGKPEPISKSDQFYFNELSTVELREYYEHVDYLFLRPRASKLLLQVCAVHNAGTLFQTVFVPKQDSRRVFYLYDAVRTDDVVAAPVILQTSAGEGEGIVDSWRESQFMKEDVAFTKRCSLIQLFVPTTAGQRFAELARFSHCLSLEARKLLVATSKVSPTCGYSVSLVKNDGGRKVLLPPGAQFSDEEHSEHALMTLLEAELFTGVDLYKWSLLPLGRVLAHIIENEPSA